jgi:hypothetical protein
MERTECKNGHPWVEANIYLADSPPYIKEQCRVCRLDASRRFRARAKAARNVR